MTQIGQDVTLELTHRFAAPRERVFDAWTNAEVLKQWWAAGATWDAAGRGRPA
jgi:uncharacterized protein YndB with AHSA1/START domain